MKNIIQLSELVFLRTLNVTDAKELFDLVDGNREYLSQWLGWVDKTQSSKDSEDFIYYANKLGENKSVTLGIYYKNQLAGTACYHPIDFKNKKVNLGYWVGQQFSGKGLATMAAEYLVSNAFLNLDLNKVEILCASENIGSQKIAERLNFKLDGVLRGNEVVGNKIFDHKAYSLLKSEWTAKK